MIRYSAYCRERTKPCRDRARFSILQCYIMDIASSHVVIDLEKSGTSFKRKISSPSVNLFFFNFELG